MSYLESELSKRTDGLVEERRSSSREQLSLRQRIAELEHSAAAAEAARSAGAQRVTELETFLSESRSRLREVQVRIPYSNYEF